MLPEYQYTVSQLESEVSSSQDLDDCITLVKKQIKTSPLTGALWAQLGFTLQVKDIRYHDSGVGQKEALFAYKMALKLLDPCSTLSLVVWYRMGILLKTMGSFQEAFDIQGSIVSKRAYFPVDRAAALHYAADALVSMNKPLQALIHYRQALHTYPKHLVSYLGIVDTLLELNTSTKNDWGALLQQMYCSVGRSVVNHGSEPAAEAATALSLKSTKTSFEIPSAFYYAMFKAANCLEEYDEAWLLLDKANLVQKQEKNFNDIDGKLENIRTNTLTIQNVFNAGFWPNGVGHPSATPVFIVGMMRSGSTLLEHLLDAHSGLVGIGEDSAMNHFLPSLLKQIQECMKPQVKSTDTSSNYIKIKKLINEVGDKIITRMTNKALDAISTNEKLHKTPSSPSASKHPVRIIDKMLFNYRNIGLIHLVFPNAIILHTIRDPLDTILGCYKQKFDDSGLDWAMDMTLLCNQYKGYLETMDHWDKLLPGRVHHVIYEDLVQDTERQSRRIICDILGLPWEDAVLTAHDRLRAVHTHSMGQVRHKVHKSAIGGWKKYSKMLVPLVQPILKPCFKNVQFIGKFPSLNWEFDVNFVQKKSNNNDIVSSALNDNKKSSDIETDDSPLSVPDKITDSIDAVVVKDNLQSHTDSVQKIEGKIAAPSENPFSSYGKLIDMSLNYDKLFHLEGIVNNVKNLLCFDSPRFVCLTASQLDTTQGMLLGAMAVNRTLLDRLSKSMFCVNPRAMEDITLYCLLLGMSQKQIHFSGSANYSKTLLDCNGITHIAFCVNKQA